MKGKKRTERQTHQQHAPKPNTETYTSNGNTHNPNHNSELNVARYLCAWFLCPTSRCLDYHYH